MKGEPTLLGKIMVWVIFFSFIGLLLYLTNNGEESRYELQEYTCEEIGGKIYNQSCLYRIRDTSTLKGSYCFDKEIVMFYYENECEE